MKPEEKELLLKVLCSGLPYGIKFACGENVYTAKGVDLIVTDEGNWEYAVTAKGIEPVEIGFIKPYLRPMSSMTSKEWVELCDCSVKDEASWVITKNRQMFIPVQSREDYLNSKHFDYRGSIPVGLALEAPEGMYNK